MGFLLMIFGVRGRCAVVVPMQGLAVRRDVACSGNRAGRIWQLRRSADIVALTVRLVVSTVGRSLCKDMRLGVDEENRVKARQEICRCDDRCVDNVIRITYVIESFLVVDFFPQPAFRNQIDTSITINKERD